MVMGCVKVYHGIVKAPMEWPTLWYGFALKQIGSLQLSEDLTIAFFFF